MQELSAHDMSDLESENEDTFIVKRPVWRTADIQLALNELDNYSPLLKRRVLGTPSKRSRPWVKHFFLLSITHFIPIHIIYEKCFSVLSVSLCALCLLMELNCIVSQHYRWCCISYITFLLFTFILMFFKAYTHHRPTIFLPFEICFQFYTVHGLREIWWSSGINLS